MAGLVTLAVVLLLAGLPLILVMTTIVTMSVLSWSPTYEPSLSVALSVATLVMTGLVVGLGRDISRSAHLAGPFVVIAALFAAFIALTFALGGLAGGEKDLPHPKVVNLSSNTVVVFTGIGDLHRWTTLAPGEYAQADRPPFSLDGCYRTMRLEARTPDGRVIESRDGLCNDDTWEITDTEG